MTSRISLLPRNSASRDVHLMYGRLKSLIKILPWKEIILYDSSKRNTSATVIQGFKNASTILVLSFQRTLSQPGLPNNFVFCNTLQSIARRITLAWGTVPPPILLGEGLSKLMVLISWSLFSPGNVGRSCTASIQLIKQYHTRLFAPYLDEDRY